MSSSGIAVGMATNVPPHNLTEVLNGCLLLLDNPKASIDEIIQIITGPDFPTGGTIDGRIGIYEGYKTGRGIIHVRAKTSVEEDKSGKSTKIDRILILSHENAKIEALMTNDNIDWSPIQVK